MQRAVKPTFTIIHLEINTTPMQQQGRLKKERQKRRRCMIEFHVILFLINVINYEAFGCLGSQNSLTVLL